MLGTILSWAYILSHCISSVYTMKVQRLLADANSLVTKGSESSYIDEAITLDRKAVELCPPSHSCQSIALSCLATHLRHRYNQLGRTNDLTEAIDLTRGALSLRPPGHPDRSTSLSNLVHYLSTRHRQLGEIDDLKEAIDFARDAMELCPPDHVLRPICLDNLALCLTTRYQQLGEMNDLNEAVVLARDALLLRLPGHPNRLTSLCTLAFRLSTRYKQLSGIDDLNEAIDLARDAMKLCPPNHVLRSTCLGSLGLHLFTRYERLGGIDDLNEAIDLTRDVLSLRPPGHPNRLASLSNLARYLLIRHRQLSGTDDLNEAIDLARDAMELCPLDHVLRPTCLNNLGLYLSARYEQLGGIDDINEAIGLARDALSLHPPGHHDRSTWLDNLSLHLSTRYKRVGGIDDLNKAIDLARDALHLRPPGDPNRSTSLNNLAHHLSIRYEQLGRVDDLDESIVLIREAIALIPLGHQLLSTSLDNLGHYLSTRYNQLGHVDDLNEAINIARDVLSLRPFGHPDRPASLSNLAHHLSTRYKQLGRIDDFNEAIDLARDAITLIPLGHQFRSTCLDDLGLHLSTRYEHLGGIDDLNEAIDLTRNALSLRPPGHPDRSISLLNLAGHLYMQYKQFGRMEDINEAIVLARDGLALCVPGHPHRSTLLVSLAMYLRTRLIGLDGPHDQEESFSLYSQLEDISQTVSSNDLSAAKAWINAAEDFHHPSTPLAYQTALRFLVQHLAALPLLPRHLALLKTHSSSLAADAFSACLRNNSPANAIELLEQGRGVFWGQLTRLRSPLDDVIASGPAGEALANRFRRLTSLIRNALDSPGEGQHDQVYRLNSELQHVVSDIRELPGLSRFLLPPLFSHLQCAASGGPVIILNSSKYSCDALIVFVDRDPAHIPLPITKDRVRELSLKLQTLTQRTKLMDMTRDFALFLRQLWNEIVSHVINYLLTICPLQSRIWWCPTAEFSYLPLHAAGPFRRDEKNLSSLYISSYTPTLTALIRARRPSPPSEMKHFIAIGQANAVGTSTLASVGTELANIGQQIDGLAMFMSIEGQDSCISRVVDELGKNEWVHLACHGIPNSKQPFESAFALHDGHFTIERIIQCDLKNSEFAYLSACHTTVGDEESPDEVIHLASAMQFAGFQSVIGTMWAVGDEHTAKVTLVFYKHMIDASGHLDHTRAAFALRKTMNTVSDIPLDQRILYIHLGA